MSKKIVVGNWKLNPSSFEEADRIVKSLSRKKINGVTLVICPPSIYLSRLIHKKSKIVFGVQDLFYEKSGAYTGEISASMVRSVGATYAIIGHSERRNYGETNDKVSLKVKAGLESGLNVVLCVGEKERDVHGHYLSYLKAQIDESLALVNKNVLNKGSLLVAYEPVWAIGEKSSGPMDARDLHETSLFVRKVLHDKFGKKAFDIPLLYGGSVDQRFSGVLVKEGEVDGLLVGRESLRPESLYQIVESVRSTK